MGIGLVSDLGGQGYYTSCYSINCDSSVNIRQGGICFPNTTAKKDLSLVGDIGRQNYGLSFYRNSTSVRLPRRNHEITQTTCDTKASYTVFHFLNKPSIPCASLPKTRSSHVKIPPPKSSVP